ncbi:MAG: AAA family ATPase, partial [Bacteroidota bacterium]
MIKTLSIQNYALIEELHLNPSESLNVITGETGAGKSIMLGAVGLLLGDRADKKVLFNEDRKCIVEGIFNISSFQLKEVFKKLDLDYESECIIRREITPAGKSRAFVNDTPTNLAVLKEVGRHLMDIHSQHQSLKLGDNEYQIQVLDAFAAHSELQQHYYHLYRDFSDKKIALEKLQEQAKKGAEDLDYKNFLFQELEAVELDGIVKEELE